MKLIDRDKLIEDYARSIATSLVLFGVDIRDKFESAISMHEALERAYVQGRADEGKRMWIPCKGCKDCIHKECEHYGKS